ncbi:hypothetical protein [Mesorhizobium sp. M7A.F.Ca.CA.002.12.1.1]|uniref:hypothetical protein n=1 Tax=Mesorhizobium sp. M7A.F.Ca.CA.002.12.1.1 TaxID=2496735 RepID=UPI000FCB344C|nr:hypothetical protein [Mesorhizobium sp. M7A.F.Ca.CA.002.12.1.1]RUX60141.1 hypothetical protein EN989_11010 [Mesorhizobium sp. M7A.F.Ca.CA.002.12.1.1]
MRNPFALLATAVVALIIAFTFPAFSATALWEKTGNWEIYGNTDTQSCGASVEYENNLVLSVIFLHGKVNISITGAQVTKGSTYIANVSSDVGTQGTFNAYAADENTLLFLDVNEITVKTLVNARVFAIKGLANFDLTGSKAAMASAWHCYQALNSF